MGLSSELKRQGKLPGQGKKGDGPTVSKAVKTMTREESRPAVNHSEVASKLNRGDKTGAVQAAFQRSVRPAVTQAQEARAARAQIEAANAAEAASRKVASSRTREDFAPVGTAKKKTRTAAAQAADTTPASTPNSQPDVTPPPTAAVDPELEPAEVEVRGGGEQGGGEGGGTSNFLPAKEEVPYIEEALPPPGEEGGAASGGGIVALVAAGVIAWFLFRGNSDSPGKLGGLPLPEGDDDDAGEVDVTPEEPHPYSQITVDKKLRALRAA